MPELKGNPSDYDPSQFSKGMTGTCLCASITVTITQPNLFSTPNGHICHCLNCRKSSGSTGVNLLLLKSENLQVSDPKGYLKTYMDMESGSGKANPRSFCSNCGNPIGAFPLGADSRLSVVALGLFPRMPEPAFELFVEHRQLWEGRATEGCEQIQLMEGAEKYVEKVLQ